MSSASFNFPSPARARTESWELFSSAFSFDTKALDDALHRDLSNSRSSPLNPMSSRRCDFSTTPGPNFDARYALRIFFKSSRLFYYERNVASLSLRRAIVLPSREEKGVLFFLFFPSFPDVDSFVDSNNLIWSRIWFPIHVIFFFTHFATIPSSLAIVYQMIVEGSRAVNIERTHIFHVHENSFEIRAMERRIETYNRIRQSTTARVHFVKER